MNYPRNKPARSSISDGGQPGHQPATRPWHAMAAAEVMAVFGGAREGLTPEDAAARLEVVGRNEFPSPPPPHPLRRLLAQFNNALILFLLAAAGVSLLLTHWVDAGVILAVVIINALIGFIQEGRAESALKSLRSMISPIARVMRSGQWISVPSGELVPGDIVMIEAGDRVPADIRLMRAKGLRVDESILTGESVANDKTEEAVPEGTALGDRNSMLYSGTMVVAGTGAGVVVATGRATEFGEISELIKGTQPLETPLLRQINRFGRRFTVFALVASLLLFAFAVLAQDHHWLDAFMLVVAIAVSVVPEGLPAVITITLAIGVRRMAARNAIIRRLPAVETLGATTVICSDKTGTLTRNEMTAMRLVTANNIAKVSGTGYAPHGRLELPEAATASDDVMALAQVAALCNDARLREIEGQWLVDGDPMEGALVALAAKTGVQSTGALERLPRQDEIPFDASTRMMATLHHCSDGSAILMTKGAPDALITLAATQVGPDGKPLPLDVDYWERAVAQAARAGERVLGFARRTFPVAPSRLTPDLIENLEFIGIVGLADPLRDEVVEAVAQCRVAGITVKMITGDHSETALAIARNLGLATDPYVVTGREIDEVSDMDLPALAQRASVFARASPAHKLRIVRALQSLGEVVAMTGDGVNDAPSLKQADVGIAMGRKGTEAAKEAAEMVLLDDDFSSIVAAVREGRTVYDNIRKVIGWTTPTNGGEVLAIVGALLFGLTLPMTPLQILWVNLISSVTLGVALAFEPGEPGSMRRPPRPAKEGLVSSFILWRIVLVSVLFTFGVVGVFTWALSRGYDLNMARTVVVNTLCMMEMFYLFNVRYLRASSFSLAAVRGTRAVLWAILALAVSQIAFTYAPWMQAAFHTRPLALVDWALILAVGVALMVVLETEKLIVRKRGVV